MPYEAIASVTPLAVAIVSALYYHFKSVSRIDCLQQDIKNLSDRLEKLETALTQDIRDLTQKLDRIIYNIASKALRTDNE